MNRNRNSIRKAGKMWLVGIASIVGSCFMLPAQAAEADVTFTLTGTYMPYPGAKNKGPTAWNYTIHNNGPDAATNVTVHSAVISPDDIFGPFFGVSLDPNLGSCTVNFHIFTCNLITLASGATVTISATSSTPGLVFNSYTTINSSFVTNNTSGMIVVDAAKVSVRAN